MKPTGLKIHLGGLMFAVATLALALATWIQTRRASRLEVELRSMTRRAERFEAELETLRPPTPPAEPVSIEDFERRARDRFAQAERCERQEQQERREAASWPEGSPERANHALRARLWSNWVASNLARAEADAREAKRLRTLR